MRLYPFHHFLSLLYPTVCLICGENLNSNENQLCLHCLHNLPRTDFHLQANNPLEKRFWGKVPVHKATAFLHFQKGSPYQKLLHQLKYKNNPEIGTILAKYAATEWSENNTFADADVIIPVPLHPKRLKMRGYNQSEMIAKGIVEILQRPLDTSTLIRITENETQTKKAVYDRYKNTLGIFDIADTESHKNKHILLVDDVLTTGSTLEACITVLRKIEGVEISVFALAMAVR
jgi:ComF family protein